MSTRALISIANGHVNANLWTGAMREEPAVTGRPKACSECPLRKGGELEEGARQAMQSATTRQLAWWPRWGCHKSERPCAGMRRLLKGARA